MNRRKLILGIGVLAGVAMVTLGVFASNDWLPKTDPMTGAKTGWFGRKLPKNSTASAWNPVVTDPTPQLSKEYIYAGSRMLAVEDANAVAAPPADIAVWRPTGGTWYVMGQTGSSAATYNWGISTDIPVPGDYDADGKTDFAIYRPSSGDWWIYYTATSTYAQIHYGGTAGDIPVAADFDGDGKTDLGIARPDAGVHQMLWYADLSGGGELGGSYGLETDTPAVADYDGDGRADIGVYRSSTDEFYWVRTSDGQADAIDLNNNGHVVVSSDYDGDGKADPAVFNTTTAYWYIYQSTTNSVVSHLWGTAGASGCTGSNCTGIVAVQNDYDGDGKTDLSVWSAGWWYIKRSTNGTTRFEQWGITGDIPVPAYYRR